LSAAQIDKTSGYGAGSGGAFGRLYRLVTIVCEHGLQISMDCDMHPANRFALFATAADELLTKNPGKLTDTDFIELTELVVQFALDTGRNRAEANLQALDNWLSRFSARLSARHLRETDN
jgi:hypothetical protein